jgi:glycosyltransferase involved in cell wall biosynthesis
MHVLHVIDGLGLGGAERMLVDIANATVRDGHRVSVCITRSETTLSSELDPTIQVLVLDRKRRVSVSAALRLARWIRHERVDVLHVHMRSSAAFILLLRMALLIRRPFVFHDHYGTIEDDRSVPTWFRLGHRFIDHYVGVYEALTDWARTAGVPATRTTTIPNTLDLSRLSSADRLDLRGELGEAPTTVIGVMVASLRRDKGIETLIDAVLRSRHRDRIRIVIAGAPVEADYAAELNDRVREHGLQGTVTFLGGRTDVPALLPAADVGLLSSHTESGPLVLIEYLAASLPIVSTKVGDIGNRLATLGVPGFVSARDPAAFAAALDEVVELSTAERARRGALGHEVLTRSWDIRSTMPTWYGIYASLRA